ncbi:Collagen adhesion protein [Bacillus mycoides]|uniref:SpaA isopeptide-forming pilin-related protein n=1 Tax=Bacillus mycoides TaxID=1405 RepID=UPI0001A034CA|nr:prealbumin-like fold domain-containing protein [Bacillus mycoides]EEK70103.1 Collagen adhesion protein [Bacillus mycoides]
MFRILDKAGKEIEKLTTDVDGKAISESLCFRKYRVEGIQVPNGYMLFRRSN